MVRAIIHVLFIFLFSALTRAEGEGSLRALRELKQAQIVDKAGAELPKDILLTDQDGHEVMLGSYFDGADRRPAILVALYFGCPRLSLLVLGGLTKSLQELSYKIGKDYRLIAVSIDHRESFTLAKERQLAYMKSMDIKDGKDWTFHVTSEGEAKRLGDAIGFNYYFDKKNDQFAHGAGFFVISPDGVLSRTFFGIEFKASDIKLALSEAADGKIGSFIDQIILSCFHYNPDSHRYGIYVFGVMRLGGVLTILILGCVLLMYFRQERKRINS